MWHFCGTPSASCPPPPPSAVEVTMRLTAVLASTPNVDLVSTHGVDLGWCEELSELPELLRAAASHLAGKIEDDQ